jgi:hypothetical protein
LEYLLDNGYDELLEFQFGLAWDSLQSIGEITAIALSACGSIGLIIGLLLYLLPKDKYQVGVTTPQGTFNILYTKNRDYAGRISGAINRALAERGPYIAPQSSQSHPGTSQPLSEMDVLAIILAWGVFIVSYVIPTGLSLSVSENEIGFVLLVTLLLQGFSLAVAIGLWASSQPTKKKHGMVMTILWLIIQAIGFCIGIFIGMSLATR